MEKPTAGTSRRRATIALGWLAGGLFGLLLSFGVYAVGVRTAWVTFALFVPGALAGMWVAERHGERAFRPLGIATGIFCAALVTLLLGVFLAN